MIASLFDDLEKPACAKHLGWTLPVTTNLNVQFLAPARAGTLLGEGRVVQLGKTIAFLEAKLHDADGTLVATATSSARLVPVEKLAA